MIDEKYRTPKRLPAGIKSRANLKEAIVLDLDESRIGCMPVRHLGQRYNIRAVKFGTTVQELLNELIAEGRVGMRRFERLGRTFIFSEAYWNECMQDIENQIDVWTELETSLHDIK